MTREKRRKRRRDEGREMKRERENMGNIFLLFTMGYILSLEEKPVSVFYKLTSDGS